MFILNVRCSLSIGTLSNTLLNVQTFPEALFHQLLLAMGHQDHETRIAAHRCLSIVLMPSLICPWSEREDWTLQDGFGLSTVGLSNVSGGSFSIPEETEAKAEAMIMTGDSPRLDNEVKQSQVNRMRSKSRSFKTAMTNGKMVRNSYYAILFLCSPLLLFK